MSRDDSPDDQDFDGESHPMGMGPEHTISMSTTDNDENHPTRVKRKETTPQRPPAPTAGLTSVSQHTEIEFYSTDDDDLDDDDDESSFYNSSEQPHPTAMLGKAPPPPPRGLNRATSRQSIQSTTSDAFSLPVGAQDDVSSLGAGDDDAGPNMTDDDYYGVDDISLKEEEKEGDSGGGGTNEDSNNTDSNPKHSQQQQRKPVIEVDTSEMFKSPPAGATAADVTRSPQHFVRETFHSSKKMLFHMSVSSQIGLDYLPEVANEDDDDDEERSLGFEDLIPKQSNNSSSDNDDMAGVTKRLYKSLFLPHGNSLLADSPSATPRARNRKHGTDNNAQQQLRGSMMIVDDFSLLAKNLPPELDLVQARKYIIQLAQGVPDATTTPGKSLSITAGESPQAATSRKSNTKSSIVESSEYSESIMEETEVEEEEEIEDDAAVPLDPRLPKTPQAAMRNMTRNKDSFMSYDFTEVVEDDDVEIIEEEIIEEEEEVIYEEEEVDDNVPASSAADALGVAVAVAGMVRTST